MGKKKNYVAELNKYARATDVKYEDVKYEDVGFEGPDHSKRFFKRAVVSGQGFPIGVGSNEKQAKQNAAKNALRCLSEKENPRPETETAAKKCTSAARGLFTEFGQKNKVTVRASESTRPQTNIATQCCSFVVGDKEYPAATGKTKKEAAQLVDDEICGSKTTEMPSCSALSDDGAPARPSTPTTLESCDAQSKSTATSIFTNSANPPKDQEQNPIRKFKRRILPNSQDASQSSNEDVTSPVKLNTGNSPSENTSNQSVFSRFKSEFDSIEQLGKGAFGHVFKAKHKLTGKDYAVKIVRCKEKALREAKALSDIDHCNIVRYFSCWLEDTEYQWDRTDDSCSTSTSSNGNSTVKFLYIQMELCDTKTLKVWIEEQNILNVTKSRRDSQRRAKGLAIAQKILSGVEYIHSKMLIHRDLKPANIMFRQEGEVKIGDFGLVTEENDDDAENLMERTVYKGTPSYMAPEQKRQRNYDRKVDIFAMGLICFEILWRISTGHERQAVWEDVRKQKFPQEFQYRFYQEYIIIRPMLCEKPAERPEACKLKMDLEECSRKLNADEIVRRGSRTV
ncbi:interferon-induced, double-stranded RNA-activated protein kinase-like isoform X2 [Plectropomus leopardus]|uniref:interferon-induced, double-stranded RNA-activated protein kinase-like isoform X2 n=1 Tax=Plectropomus leopardus TaxID=160734 RepID=UPI001C4CCF03|nr:interferon-induced, double-stranded RNA-activated protein kinase-like isoform X2 [Plectropomus leopardus]